MTDLSERTKVTLGAVAIALSGALAAQGYVLVALTGRPTAAEVAATYVRQDVMALELREIRLRLDSLQRDVDALRRSNEGEK